MQIREIFRCRVVLALAQVALLATFFSACQSAHKKEAQQQVVPDEKERMLAQQLDHNIQRAYGAWNDQSVEKTLNAMLAKLVAADAAYSKEAGGAHVRLLSTQTPYIAAGLNRTVYVSRGALSHVFYENELATLLGAQLALIKDNAPSKSLANLQGQEVGESLITLPTTPPAMNRDYIQAGWFEAGGLFDYGHDAYLKAESDGIRLAYAAKYDPRGAVTLIQRWTSAPVAQQMRAIGKILPEPEDRLNNAREEVAKLSPLRDPIVKTQAFEDLMARIHVKKAKTPKKQK